MPQAYYNKQAGITRLATETGAGQWGSALSFATQKFGLEGMVYIVKVSFDQKPYRKAMMRMYTLGHDFIPPGIHAGGLRYHGMAPIVSALYREKVIEVMALHQLECFGAGVLFAKTEGIIPAPESCHAIRAAIMEATRDLNEPKTIFFNLSGHGLLDLASYEQYHAGALYNYEYPAEAIAEATKHLPKIG